MNQKRRKKPSLLVNLILGLGALSVIGLLIGVPLLLLRKDPVADIGTTPPESTVSSNAPVVPGSGSGVDSGAPAAGNSDQLKSAPIKSSGANAEQPTDLASQSVSMGVASSGKSSIAEGPAAGAVEGVSGSPTPAAGASPIGMQTGALSEDKKMIKPDLPEKVVEPNPILTDTKMVAVGSETLSTPAPSSVPPNEVKPEGLNPKISSPIPSPMEVKADSVQNEEQLERFKEDVYARIEAARNEDYPLEMKEAARETLRRVKGLFKVGTVVFTKPGSKELDPVMETELLVKLQHPDIVKWSDLPEARIISLGFADPTGTSTSNAVLSRDRAVAVNDFIKSELPAIRTYGFGIGATTVVDKKTQENNRAVEIWLAVGQAAGAN